MQHFLSGLDLRSDCPQDCESIVFGAGCFWGVEKKFWSLDGVWLTSVGYSGGALENPSYQEVCSGTTDHVEVVKVIFNPDIMPVYELLKVFWECHDPTQGMRQGNDVGTQYRSVIYSSDPSDLDIANESKEIYQQELEKNNYSTITTEIDIVKNYFLAEEYHQQYLAKNPNGYCGIGGTGCTFPNE